MIDAYILMDIITDHNLCKTQKETLQSVIDKIEQGTLIELPCKVGDSFYSYEGFKYQCLGLEIAKDGIYLRTVYDMKFLFGKDAFLTREEAEKRLKELQNG